MLGEIHPGLVAMIVMIGGALFFGDMLGRGYREAVKDTRKEAVDRRMKQLDMSGFVFVEGLLRYETDRSIMLAERYDEWNGNPRYHCASNYRHAVTRLFYDTVLEQIFVVRWEQKNMGLEIEKSAHVFWSRDELINFCQEKFPDQLHEIMETEFSFPSRFPTDDEILRSRYGTNDYIPVMKEQEEAATA